DGVHPHRRVRSAGGGDLGGVQRQPGGGQQAGLHRPADERERGGLHLAGGAGDGAGRVQQHGDRVHGQHHGGDRHQPWRGDVVGDDGGVGGGRRGDVLQPVHRQGGDGLHAGGGVGVAGGGDLRGVQHQPGGGEPAGLQRPT